MYMYMLITYMYNVHVLVHNPTINILLQYSENMSIHMIISLLYVHVSYIHVSPLYVHIHEHISGHKDVVELLLSYNSNIEHQNKAGCTPLMLAARYA